MATKESPVIVEPSTSSDGPLPSIPSLSPNPSSSSDSFNSSRPNSQGSSATSRSVSPSPIPKSVPATGCQESTELPASSPNPPLPETTSESQSHQQNEPPRSIASAQTASPRTNHQASWLSRLLSRISRRDWFANALGVITLGLTLIGMILFGERTYKLAVWSAWNDALDTCGQLNSTGLILGSNCKKLLSNNTADVTLPPYNHWKRSLNATLQAGSRLLKESFTERSTFSVDKPANDAATSSFYNFTSIATVLASTVIIGCLSLIVFRRYWRTEEIFTSPVRSDWQFTRHHQEGPETVIGEGYRMTKRNPEDDHPLGQLRQRIRSSQPNAVENPTGEPTWQSHNTSEDTLVGPWKDTKWGSSKVSLTNDTSDEKRENLIELETEGPNKTFFDPETGEFIHLTPWKSTGDEEVHGLRPDGKGSIKRALAQMTLGASGWAGGKSIDDQLAEELQANSRGRKKKEPNPHKPGDCITGDMTNGVPSGKPTTDPTTALDEEDTEDVDPKVTESLLRRPWYADTKHDTDEDSYVDAESNTEGAGSERMSASPSESDNGQDDADFWIPQTTRDGRLFYFNTLTGVSRSELPPEMFRLADRTPDWEKEAMDSSQLPYADRDDTSVYSASFESICWMDDDEEGDIESTLAKLEGRYSKSQAGSSEAQAGSKSNVDQERQTLLAEAKRTKVASLPPRQSSDNFDRVISDVRMTELIKSYSHKSVDDIEAVTILVSTPNSGRSSGYLGDESFLSDNTRRAEQAGAMHAGVVHAELQTSKLADHVRADARVEIRKKMWKRLRSILNFDVRPGIEILPSPQVP